MLKCLVLTLRRIRNITVSLMKVCYWGGLWYFKNLHQVQWLSLPMDKNVILSYSYVCILPYSYPWWYGLWASSQLSVISSKFFSFVMVSLYTNRFVTKIGVDARSGIQQAWLSYLLMECRLWTRKAIEYCKRGLMMNASQSLEGNDKVFSSRSLNGKVLSHWNRDCFCETKLKTFDLMALTEAISRQPNIDHVLCLLVITLDL